MLRPADPLVGVAWTESNHAPPAVKKLINVMFTLCPVGRWIRHGQSRPPWPVAMVIALAKYPDGDVTRSGIWARQVCWLVAVTTLKKHNKLVFYVVKLVLSTKYVIAMPYLAFNGEKSINVIYYLDYKLRDEKEPTTLGSRLGFGFLAIGLGSLFTCWFISYESIRRM